MIALPALLLPGAGSDSTQVISLIAFVAAALTFVEYFSAYPSIVEFRDAKPFNRLRFVCLLATVFVLSMICRDKLSPSHLTQFLSSIGVIVGNLIDFPYSPVRMVVLMMPAGAPGQSIDSVRTAAGIAYVFSGATLLFFLFIVRFKDWPHRSGVFNVWVNLPLFDPTAGGDVLARLKRDAQINIVLGFLLPFLIPAVIKAASDVFDPIILTNPQTLVWMMTAWAFLPASMIMRGVALGRVAEMIEEKRRRAFAKAELATLA
jgi:hypothetical protein